MATQVQALTSAAVDLVAELSLADGTAYVVQAIGDRTVRLAEAAAAPSDPYAGHLLTPGETWSVQASATPIWAWTLEAAGGRVAVTEA